MEECAEVIQRASKQIQFGKDEVQKNQALDNATRLKNELLDVNSLFRLLRESGELTLEADDFEKAYETKKLKLQVYADLSTSLGQLPEIRI
jgi:hypothetical protein